MSMGVRRALRMAAVLLRVERGRMVAIVVAAGIVTFASSVALFARAGYVGEITGVRLGAGTGDALPWLFLGDPVGLKVEWLVPWVMLLVAAQPSSMGASEAVCLATGRRSGIWLASCVAAASRALVMLLALAAFEVLWLLALGARPGVGPRLLSSEAGGMLASCATGLDVGRFGLLLALGAVMLALLQLVIGLVSGRVAALLACVVMLVVSAFVPELPLPGSCLMASRVAGLAPSAQAMADLVPAGFDMALLLLVALGCAALGSALVQRCDIGG